MAVMTGSAMGLGQLGFSGQRFEGPRYVQWMFERGHVDLAAEAGRATVVSVEVLPGDRDRYPELGRKQWVNLLVTPRKVREIGGKRKGGATAC